MNPYSLRHTVARHLRASGVPAWEVSAQLGHKRKDLSITEIYAPFDPSYLSNAVAAIDLYLKDVLVSPEDRPLVTREKSCTSHVPSDEEETNQDFDFIGAGDVLQIQNII